MTTIWRRVYDKMRRRRNDDETMGTAQPAGRIRRRAVTTCVVSWVVAMRGGRGGWPGGRVERVVGTLLIVELGSLGFFGKNDGGAVGRYYSVKNYGTPPNKVSLQTKSGAGNTIMISELTGGVDMMGLLVFKIN